MLIVEDAVEEGTLAEAVTLLKEAARKAMLSAIQESELIQRVCGWAGQGTYQQDPALPQGYEGRTVIPYPYTPALPDNLWNYRVHDIRSTPYTTEVCGIRVVLVTDKRGYPAHIYDTCAYYDALGRVGCTAEEATRAMHRLSQAMYAASHAEGQYTQALNSTSHAEGRSTCIQEEEDSLFTKYTVYSVPTPEGKPVRLAYEDTDTDAQQHSDTHIQQEDTTQVYSVEDTHYYTRTDTLTHNDVVYDTQEIDTYIHSMIDIH